MSVLLIVAKAPVPGLAKTRLCPPATPERAADIAAAALLDTVDAALAVPDAHTVVAMTGSLADACRAQELTKTLRHSTTIPQRGENFADRLAGAHADVARLFPGRPVLQIGMDTPQVTGELLADGLRRLPAEEALLGAATDGGWWALGLRDPGHAAVLRGVPMSEPDTGAQTRAALSQAGLRVGSLPELSDVDTVEDAVRVAGLCGHSRFGAAVDAVAALTGAPR